MREGNKYALRHGMHGTPTYQAWIDMRRRCEKQSHPAFRLYGARGISVCEKWKDFSSFLSDMGVRPDGLSLDRIDNDGNYCPENCRWIALSAQQKNRRDCVFIEHGGKKMTIADWSREIGISAAALQVRVRLGWPHSKIVTTPIRGKHAAI